MQAPILIGHFQKVSMQKALQAYPVCIYFSIALFVLKINIDIQMSRQTYTELCQHLP